MPNGLARPSVTLFGPGPGKARRIRQRREIRRVHNPYEAAPVFQVRERQVAFRRCRRDGFASGSGPCNDESLRAMSKILQHVHGEARLSDGDQDKLVLDAERSPLPKRLVRPLFVFLRGSWRSHVYATPKNAL